MDQRPTAEEVVSRLKDDGDFDALRLKIVRKVKENEELRKSIIMEVKQSILLNSDGFENMKPRQLSDGIYQEIGSKIMGQISDEVWRVIRSSESKSEIKETVESVYNRIVNPETKKEKKSSPSKQKTSSKQDNLSVVATSVCDMKESDGSEPMELPPGFGPSDQHRSIGDKNDNLAHDQQRCSPSKEELHHQPDVSVANGDDRPPGFGGQLPTKMLDVGSDEDPDVPPGFGLRKMGLTSDLSLK